MGFGQPSVAISGWILENDSVGLTLRAKTLTRWISYVCEQWASVIPAFGFLKILVQLYPKLEFFVLLSVLSFICATSRLILYQRSLRCPFQFLKVKPYLMSTSDLQHARLRRVFTNRHARGN
jgi:hypothetical protein